MAYEELNMHIKTTRVLAGILRVGWADMLVLQVKNRLHIPVDRSERFNKISVKSLCFRLPIYAT